MSNFEEFFFQEFIFGLELVVESSFPFKGLSQRVFEGGRLRGIEGRIEGVNEGGSIFEVF